MGKFEKVTKLEEDIKDLLKNETFPSYVVKYTKDEWGCEEKEDEYIEQRKLESDNVSSIASKVAWYIYNNFCEAK